MGIASARPASRLSRIGLALALAAPLALLSACDEETYPTAANTEAPPPAQPQELMGAPDAPPPSAEAPPATAEGPPPYAPAPPQASMAPIPNPGEPGADAFYGDRVHGRYAEADAGAAAEEPAPVRRRWRGHRFEHVAEGAAPRLRGQVHPASPQAQSEGPAGGHAATQAQAQVQAHARAPAHAPSPAGTARSAPVVASASGRPASYPATSGTRPGPGSQTPAVADAAPRVEALRTALGADLARSAVLAVPGTLKADVPVDVSLTVPDSFFAKLRDKAGAEGLNEEAASASLTTQLTGQGYGIMPSEPQTQPLASGRATTFHWVVTPAAGPRTPLRAAVTANLLGGGAQALALGDVQAGSRAGGLTVPRMLGAGLLILVGAGVLAWLFRSRTPTHTTSAFSRRAPSRARPPLDLTPDAPSDRRS